VLRPGFRLQDGKTIISGWSDGKIRGFGPQSGKLLYTINDAHHKAVTAIAVTSDSSRIISGGEEGERHTLHVTCVFAALHPSSCRHMHQLFTVSCTMRVCVMQPLQRRRTLAHLCKLGL
jgi:WD40 repeat protein